MDWTVVGVLVTGIGIIVATIPQLFLRGENVRPASPPPKPQRKPNVPIDTAVTLDKGDYEDFAISLKAGDLIHTSVTSQAEIDYFVVDENNRGKCEKDEQFDSQLGRYAILEDSSDVNIPTAGLWYLYVRNAREKTLVRIKAEVVGRTTEDQTTGHV